MKDPDRIQDLIFLDDDGDTDLRSTDELDVDVGIGQSVEEGAGIARTIEHGAADNTDLADVAVSEDFRCLHTVHTNTTVRI